MSKVILITGATDGIGHALTQMLAGHQHHLIVHGRNPDKLAKLCDALAEQYGQAQAVESYCADLSKLADVTAMADAIKAKHQRLDVLLNNAGILKAANTVTDDGLDVRFMVNTIAPYHLTQQLLPLMDDAARVINLSSAAQAAVNLNELNGHARTSDDMSAYAQSKLAITAWTRELAANEACRPMMVSVNPGSLLASKMVKEGFNVEGKDINIGADILMRAALSDEFSSANGQYFDNDSGQFASPHPQALDDEACTAIVAEIEAVISRLSS